jgi:hypothetical protein
MEVPFSTLVFLFFCGDPLNHSAKVGTNRWDQWKQPLLRRNRFVAGHLSYETTPVSEDVLKYQPQQGRISQVTRSPHPREPETAVGHLDIPELHHIPKIEKQATNQK